MNVETIPNDSENTTCQLSNPGVHDGDKLWAIPQLALDPGLRQVEFAIDGRWGDAGYGSHFLVGESARDENNRT